MVGEDENFLEEASDVLEGEGVDVDTRNSSEASFEVTRENYWGAILISDSIELLEDIEVPSVVLGDTEDNEEILEAVNTGADGFLRKLADIMFFQGLWTDLEMNRQFSQMQVM